MFYSTPPKNTRGKNFPYQNILMGFVIRAPATTMTVSHAFLPPSS